MSIHRVVLCIFVVCCLITPCVFCTEAVSERTQQSPWQQFNLRQTNIAGAEVYYEESLEPNLPIFEQQYKQFLVEAGQVKKILDNKLPIIEEINHIVGSEAPDTQYQIRMIENFCKAFDFKRYIFRLIRQETTKEFLRKGGQLPDLTYDSETDQVEYKLLLHEGSDVNAVEVFEIVLPIGDKTEQDIPAYFDRLKRLFGAFKTGIAIHEVSELTLLMKLKPTDVHCRWFSDGFANVMADYLVEKYIGRDAAGQLAKGHDPNKYADVKEQINLRYWMSLNWFMINVPTEYEQRLKNARYAYATLEVQRLVDEHGLESITKILEKISPQESRGSAELIQAISDVTGEQMDARLNAYQTFTDIQQGQTKYGSLYKQAPENDYSTRLSSLLRFLELQGSAFSPRILSVCKEAAVLLCNLGHEEAGDEIMDKCLELAPRTDSPEQARYTVMEMYVFYGLDSKRPERAMTYAQELLKVKPDHIGSLLLQMFVHDNAGRAEEAKKIAVKLCQLESKNSPVYKAALEILNR